MVLLTPLDNNARSRPLDGSLPGFYSVGIMTLRAIVAQKLMNALGWELIGVADMPKAVIAAFPHTSNMDLLIGLLTAAALDIKISWLGKKELFETPVQAWVMRQLGGIPVDRSGHHNLVQQVAERFAEADRMYLVLAPEGTRSLAESWKSGFYWIAHEARVPVVGGALDYQRKRAGISGAIDSQQGIHQVMEALRQFFDGNAGGRYPSKVGPVRLRDESA